MKRIFRRNQIIITTLAVMIAAAGYLNYSSKKEVAGAEVYEAGMMDISDSDILAENQARSGVDDGSLTEIASLDGEEKLPDGNEVAAVPESAEVSGSEAAGEETAAAGIENPGEAVLTGGTGISEYIAGVQLGREQIRAKNKETLMQIINSDHFLPLLHSSFSHPLPCSHHSSASSSVITIPSAPISVFLFTISSICARSWSVSDAAFTTTSAFPFVMLTTRSTKPFALRSVSAAFSFSETSVRPIRFWIAVCFSSSEERSG